MARLSNTKGIYRVLDANINRAKEGLRVCEEVTRFIIGDRNLTAVLKKLRHRIDTLVNKLPDRTKLLYERESRKDVGRTLYNKKDLKRADFKEVFLANMQRIKESLRVLEEFSKLDDVSVALKFMEIRYDTYEIEKKVIKRLSSLYHHR